MGISMMAGRGSEVSALSGFSADSDLTCNGDDNDDEIDAVGDNDSLVTTRGRMENMARIIILDLTANFTGFVDYAAAVLTIGTTIERGKKYATSPAFRIIEHVLSGHGATLVISHVWIEENKCIFLEWKM